MSRLLLTGGTQRKSLLGGIPEWALFEEAVVGILDTASGQLTKTFTHVSPPEVRPNPGCHVFKCGVIDNGFLWVTTQTEVLKVNLSSFEIEHIFSHKSYNDLHHVMFYQGRMCAVSTGLDCLVYHNEQGEPVEWDHALGEEVSTAFDLSRDWRQEATTKPHASHPNYCFETKHGLWMTRFNQKDAICLSDRNRRIPIDIGNPHDGLVHDGDVWFTTTNGNLVQTDPDSGATLNVYDLNVGVSNPAPLGWCRGLHIEGTLAYVGFSRIRTTKIHKNLSWIKHGFRLPEGHENRESRVAAYDLETRKFVAEWDIEPIEINALFSVLPLP